MIITTPTIVGICAIALSIVGTFGVNYAQIQVNTSDIEHSEQQNKERYDNIQKKLDSIEDFLRNGNDDKENDD